MTWGWDSLTSREGSGFLGCCNFRKFRGKNGYYYLLRSLFRGVSFTFAFRISTGMFGGRSNLTNILPKEPGEDPRKESDTTWPVTNHSPHLPVPNIFGTKLPVNNIPGNNRPPGNWVMMDSGTMT